MHTILKMGSRLSLDLWSFRWQPSHVSCLLLTMFCSVLFFLQVLGVHLNKWTLDWRLGLACLILYAIFLCFSILIEFNVFIFVNLPMCRDIHWPHQHQRPHQLLPPLSHGGIFTLEQSPYLFFTTGLKSRGFYCPSPVQDRWGGRSLASSKHLIGGAERTF